jgi:integrase
MPSRLAARRKVAAATDKTGYKIQGFIILRPQIHGGLHDGRHRGSALMRDTGMRNERELFQMRIENLDWQNRVIFVPDSKTAEGRRVVPMSRQVFEILQNGMPPWPAQDRDRFGRRKP